MAAGSWGNYNQMVVRLQLQGIEYNSLFFLFYTQN